LTIFNTCDIIISENGNDKQREREEPTMTKLEMKKNLAEKCKDSWEMLIIYRRVFGTDSVQAEKMQTSWVNYDSLYKEFFGEEVEY
jgi:hypothetical protein